LQVTSAWESVHGALKVLYPTSYRLTHNGGQGGLDMCE
jgi:hypothetical protein